ncbi:MAG: 4Fe-4S binding protein [SAR324 cluster bacterium]|nr:4Fe-4S binding protein [SAR324 cluster bacterium]
MISIIEDRCVGCSLCVPICFEEALSRHRIVIVDELFHQLKAEYNASSVRPSSLLKNIPAIFFLAKLINSS